MANVMMILGVYPFSLRTAAYEQLQRSASYRWQGQDRVGRLPAQQYVGPGAMDVSINGTILPHWNGGLYQVDAMRAAAGLGKPLLMVDGTGRVWGDWVIMSIAETETEHFADGVPREIGFSMKLREYGGDNGGLGLLSLGIAAFNVIGRL